MQLETEDEPTAAQYLQGALGIHQDIGHRLGQAITLGYLGRLYRRRESIQPRRSTTCTRHWESSVKSVTGTAKWVSSTTAER